jgi:endoribonuclease LACTB2
MLDYLASLRRFLALPRLTALFPAHGPAQSQVQQIIEYYLAHRQEREARIVEALTAQAQSIPELVTAIYTDVPSSRHSLAALSVQAHLEKLEIEGRVFRQGERFALQYPTTWERNQSGDLGGVETKEE